MFLKTGVTTAVLMIIIGTSNVFGMVVAFEELASKLEVLINQSGYFDFILGINVIFLFRGITLPYSGDWGIASGQPYSVVCPLHPPSAGLYPLTAHDRTGFDP